LDAAGIAVCRAASLVYLSIIRINSLEIAVMS
jgi:hypothetical protein